MVGSGQGANAPSDKKLKQLVGVYVVGMKVMVTVMVTVAVMVRAGVRRRARVRMKDWPPLTYPDYHPPPLATTRHHSPPPLITHHSCPLPTITHRPTAATTPHMTTNP